MQLLVDIKTNKQCLKPINNEKKLKGIKFM